LVLLVEESKEEGFREGIRRKDSEKEGFRRKEKGYR
jgi:hypothetical protein